MEAWANRFGWIVAGALLAVFGGLYALFGAYVVDDFRMDRIVAAVALDWRDFGEEKARQRLQYELDHQGIGAWVRDEDCALVTEETVRVVRCGWTVSPVVPGYGPMLLRFDSLARVTADGDLR